MQPARNLYRQQSEGARHSAITPDVADHMVHKGETLSCALGSGRS
jgi:hypothetical protein